MNRLATLSAALLAMVFAFAFAPAAKAAPVPSSPAVAGQLVVPGLTENAQYYYRRRYYRPRYYRPRYYRPRPYYRPYYARPRVVCRVRYTAYGPRRVCWRRW